MGFLSRYLSGLLPCVVIKTFPFLIALSKANDNKKTDLENYYFILVFNGSPKSSVDYIEMLVI